MKKHIPNFLTLANLFCGCCALVCILNGLVAVSAFFIGLALLLDWLDGTAARLLNVQSPLGGQLDSMADMVSFGVVPGAILYQMLDTSMTLRDPDNISWVFNYEYQIVGSAIPAFILTCFSGLRLAKFNLDTRQTDSFIGLPTPACTMFVLGLGIAWDPGTLPVHLLNETLFPRELLGHPSFIYAVVVIFSWLLVAEIPMFSLKIKPGSSLKNWLPIVGAIIAAGLLLWFFHGLGLSLLIAGYVLISVLFYRKNVA